MESIFPEDQMFGNSLFSLAVKPRFSEETGKAFAVVEGDTLNVTLKATGNPPQIKYKWILPRPSEARIQTEGPFLLLTKAQRSDRGNYSILAWNGHGNFNTTVTIFVDVLFAPRSVTEILGVFFHAKNLHTICTQVYLAPSRLGAAIFEAFVQFSESKV